MLCMLCLVSALFGVGGSLMISMSYQGAMAQEREAALGVYRTVSGILMLVSGADGGMSRDELAETLGALPEQITDSWLALRLRGADGILYETGPGIESPPDDAYRPGFCAVRYTHAAEGRYILTVCGTLTAGEETLYLDIDSDVSGVFSDRGALVRAYERVFVVVIVLCAALSYALSRFLTRPLARLSEASRAIAAGELSARADVSTRDELGQLAGDFNAMAQSMETTVRELEETARREKRFTDSFAHEVKTPMTSIIGYADLIRGGALTDDERREAANFIVTEGKRLERLSRRLLELHVMRGDIALSPVCPRDIIEDLTERWCGVYAEEGVALACRCEDGVCLSEPELLRALIMNLWDNARKAMAGRGGHIDTECVLTPEGCRVCVADDGLGIPPQALPHLTEAFYRVDKSRSRALGGAGLGLTLCREIAELHGGELRFDSEPGRGTAVTAVLRGGRP